MPPLNIGIERISKPSEGVSDFRGLADISVSLEPICAPLVKLAPGGFLKNARIIMASQKIALVTGAGSGIGRSVALALLREGYSVVLTGRRPGPLEETAAVARDSRGRALVVPADVTNSLSVEGLFSKLKDVFGRLDLLFNN